MVSTTTTPVAASRPGSWAGSGSAGLALPGAVKDGVVGGCSAGSTRRKMSGCGHPTWPGCARSGRRARRSTASATRNSRRSSASSHSLATASNSISSLHAYSGAGTDGEADDVHAARVDSGSGQRTPQGAGTTRCSSLPTSCRASRSFEWSTTATRPRYRPAPAREPDCRPDTRERPELRLEL